jgi:phosphatidylinositol alpha-mannosyltransferase
LADLAWYLAEAGHEVDVITGVDGPSNTRTEGRVVTRGRRHMLPRVLERRGATRLDTFGVVALPPLLRRRYDVVHALTPSAALAARAAGQRTVYTVLGHPTAEQFGRRPGDRRLMAAAIRAAHITTALSKASAAAVVDMFGRPAEVVPPGIRLDAFPPRAAPPDGNPPRLLLSAAMSNPYKGLDVVLRALVRLHGDGRDVELWLSGPGDPDWAFRAVGEDAAVIAGAVRNLGVGDLEDVPARYRAATATLLPSLHEAFGLALVESLASGAPVVCADAGGPPEIVDDPAVGRVVPYGDDAALAQAACDVIALAADPATPGRCRTHAARWGWMESIGPMHEALYADIVKC